jgi:tRNA modification GTPase
MAAPDPTPTPTPLPPRARDPIVAIATAAGRGAVGIVRASGRDLAPLVLAVCGRALPPRQAVLLPFRDAAGRALDKGLALHFPAPHSYTGEDVLELQAHGGPVVLRLLLARCLQALPGLRVAEPGEFTERAFLHGKLDLAQAEAVADLIDASTEAAARSAARSLQGDFSAQVNALATQVIALRTLVEATLDFPEEEIDFLQAHGARERLAAIAQAVDAALARARQGALLREGLRVVLAGQPNVGKSSLLNALAGAELAIVTPIPGTTRDRISQAIQVEGVPLHVTDTAGLREPHEAADAVERIGIERSWQAIAQADVLLLLHDLSRRGEPAYEAADARLRAQLAAHAGGVPRIDVFNKADLPTCAAPAHPPAPTPKLAHGPTDGDIGAPAPAAGEAPLCVSALTGQGLDALRAALLHVAGWQPAAEGLFTARARHVEALRRTREHLAAARAIVDQPAPALDLLAEELRLAHRALGEITGAFGTEDLLGAIFSSFCIGK